MASVFGKILYVCRELNDESAGLAQALELAAGETRLDLLLLAPELEGYLERYRESFDKALRDRLRDSLENAARQSGRRPAGESRIDVESGEMPALRIIRRVQRDSVDLVVKQAEGREEGRGFRALDMELLRKCPSPVWLWRPRRNESGGPRIAVAVDPQSRQKAGRELALDLLKMSASLAQLLNGRLSVVSCWQDAGEEFLRSTLRASVPEDELLRVSRELQARHRRELDELLHEAGVNGASVQRRHGAPDRMIPAFIAEEAIDLLVMGTVARTGIPGFILGNTAENILQKVDCSLLALKPPGFVSPVREL